MNVAVSNNDADAEDRNQDEPAKKHRKINR